MRKSELKLVQHILSEMSLYRGGSDGVRGPKTNAAIATLLQSHASQLPADWQQWSDKRKQVAALQLLCSVSDINAGSIDGWYGPQTAAAAQMLKQLKLEGSVSRSIDDLNPLDLNPHNFPRERPAELTAFYGEPGQVPLTKVQCPWNLRLDWNLNQSTRKISIHSSLADSLGEILEQIHQHYGEDGIKRLGLDRYGGSYNARKKRGSRTSWSTHAWGVALDWYPSRNKLNWRSDRATLAHSDLDFFWQCWEQQGWLSLGRTEDRDWMHIQAAKR